MSRRHGHEENMKGLKV